MCMCMCMRGGAVPLLSHRALRLRALHVVPSQIRVGEIRVGDVRCIHEGACAPPERLGESRERLSQACGGSAFQKEVRTLPKRLTKRRILE